MYTVTNEYETYVKSEARNYSMTGSIVNKNNVTMQITRDNILEGSLSFTNRCTANNSFDIGGCCIGSMEITLQGDYHHSLYNAVITLQQGVYVTGDSYHMEKVGTWIIKKAHWNGEWVTLECYDAMCLTQKKYTLTTGSFTPYSFFTAMCNDCGITLATTQAEIEAMVNGTATLIFNGSTQETDRKWSDLIHDMCAVICGFCSINRFGNLEVHQFGKCYKRVGTAKTYYTNQALDTLTKNDRITGGAFGNGAINITGLYINDRASKNADKSILVGSTSGTTLNLGYNRWLSSATSGYATYLQNILTQLTACQFYAADVHLADVSLYDLGDLITLQAGGELSLSEDILMCIMNIDYNFADESTISSYTFSESSNSSTSSVESNLTNRIESLENASGSGGNKIYTSTRIPTSSDTANEGDLWYKVKRRGHFEGAVLKCIRAGKMTHPNMEFSVGQYVRVNYGNYYNNNTPCLATVNESWAGWAWYEYISLNANGIINADVNGNPNTMIVPNDNYPVLYGSQTLRLWTCNYDEERKITSNEVARDGFGRSGVGYEINYQGKNYWRWSTVTIKGILLSVYYDAATSDEHMVDPAAVQAEFDSLALFEIVDWGEGTNYGYDGTIIERMVLERYIKYDGVWVKADYKAGKGIIIGDGEISVDVSTSVDIVQTVTSGTQLATINGTSIYAPTVSATQTQTSGTEIGTIAVGDTSTKLYAPTTTVTQVQTSGTEIAQINGTSLYAPSGGSNVTVTPKTSTGTNIADIEVDGTTYQLFAPSGGGGGGSGSGYTKTILWSGYKADTGTITLSDSVENYDIVLIKMTSHPDQPSNSYYESYFTILPDEIIYNQSAQYCLLTIRGNAHYGNGSMDCYFSNSTSFVIETINIDQSATQVKPAVLEVIGLKFGGSSSGSGNSLELLWTNSAPIADFAPQTIAIDLSRYKGVVVDFLIATDSLQYVSAICMLNEVTRADSVLHLSNAFQMRYRDVTPTSTGVVFSDGHAVLNFNGTSVEVSGTMIPYHIYGFGGGSSGHNYSTEEQVVGTWIDGSTLYEKTVVLSNAISVPSGSGSWTTLMSYADFGVDNLYNPIGITCYQSYFAVWGCFSVQAYDGNIYVQQNRGNAVTIDKFTLQYTKTS